MADHDQEVSEQQDNLFYAFAQETLSRLKALVEPIGGVPEQMGYNVSFGEESSTRTIQTKKDYRKVLLHYQFQIFLEEEPQLTELMQQPEPIVSRAVFEFAIITANRLLLFDIIKDAIERFDTLDLTRDQLIESFHRYRTVWTAPTLRYETVVPLLNFKSDVRHEVTLGRHLALSPFTPEEKTQAWNSDVDFYPTVKNPIEFNAFLQSKYKLACIRFQDQKKEYSTEDVNEELMDVLTALRLTKAGDVGAPAIFERSELQSRLMMPTATISRTNDYVVRQSGTEYNITEAELSQVNKLFVSLQGLNAQAQRGGLTVALRRFNQAYSRENDEDRIIDLTITLESCLLAGLSKELSYRFILRGAALLSERRDPKETKALLKEIYDNRSSIVHDGKTLLELKKGSKHDPPDHAAKEFLRQSEEIVRDILREYVIQMASKKLSVKKVNEQLELGIIERLAPQER